MLNTPAHTPPRSRRPQRPTARPDWNPLAAGAGQPVRYAAFDGDRVVHPHAPGAAATDELVQAHAELRAHVQDTSFPCVGAKSAFNRKRYRFGLYGDLGDRHTARAVTHDLYEFSREFKEPGNEPVTFLAMFGGAAPRDDMAFERQLWTQLQHMHEIDANWFGWDPAVSPDPDSDEFSFSIGERAYFLVGLHPNASRVARRTARPTIAFNLHEQFEALRERGKYEAMQNAIRERDVALQGSVNPVLRQFGDGSEARQYSGRPVPDGWQCPFHHRHAR